MDLERALSGGGMTSVSYWTYKCVLWPVGTFLAGVEGLGLVWSAIAAIPIFAIQYSLERKRHEKSADKTTKTHLASASTISHDAGRKGDVSTEERVTAWEAAAAMLIFMLALYYAGSAIVYFLAA
jgi:hypothetical protein